LPIVTVDELLEAGVHFGHRTSRWNPKMKPYLQGKRNQIHIIDLRETVKGLLRGVGFLERATTEGYDVLFVGTKRGAKAVIREESRRCNMPFVTERWLGGTLTNFDTIRLRLQRLEELESLEQTGETSALTKKELSAHNREKRKLLKNLEGIRHMSQLPGAIVIVDPRREHIAVREANRMNIPIVALVDSDCDPTNIDVPIPANDDAMRSVSVIVKRLSDACELGRKASKMRTGELHRAMDSTTADAIAVATGEAGRRGPAKKVVVRRAQHAEPHEEPAEPAPPPAPAAPPTSPAAPPTSPAAPAADEEPPAA
jgi:small subunit ribosomal protein S2